MVKKRRLNQMRDTPVHAVPPAIYEEVAAIANARNIQDSENIMDGKTNANNIQNIKMLQMDILVCEKYILQVWF